MDTSELVIVLVVIALASFHVFSRRRNEKLPPGPYPFPIIGNILQLGSNPHQSLAKLSNTHGPLMSLRLGSLYTVVASSPQVAKQVLLEHDQALCSRMINSATQAHDFHNNSLVFLPVSSSKWKKARKICREHLFSTLRLDESQGLRLEKVAQLHDYLLQCSGRAVNVGKALFTTSINLMTATLFSIELATFESDVVEDLKESIEGVVTTLGTPNVADFFPILKPFDPQGIKRRSEFYMGKMINLVGELIDQRLQQTHSPKKRDLLESLFSLGDANFSIDDIKHLFVDLFIAQTHTTTTTVEWALTELILNPAKMAIAQKELSSVIGKNKQVQESDISRLPYLQAVIKETLRIHPPSPLLTPRKADYEVEINGFTMPKNAQIFVNVWAIGRDPSVWPNPTLFEPERFFNSEIDYRGRDFELLPFGSGRRICPGISMADRMIPLMVATMIHNFEWKLESGVKPDTTEKFGVALCKAVPLVVIPIQAKCE